LESGDQSPERAAIRETEEELGMDLSACARQIGALSELRARAMMRLLPMSVFPFVFELLEPVSLRKNQEVASACWVPLEFFLDGANRSTMAHPREPGQSLPCYPMGERVFWGLSLAMLDELLLILP
jgi:8-oxo-dGTP pyrophosphatase MutT (NUDIX family)